MASKSFSKKSVGTTFEAKSNGLTDLSDLADASLLGGSSQSGGNTTSMKDTSLQTATPGTQSEQTSTDMLGGPLAQTAKVLDPAAMPKSDNRKEVH